MNAIIIWGYLLIQYLTRFGYKNVHEHFQTHTAEHPAKIKIYIYIYVYMYISVYVY